MAQISIVTPVYCDSAEKANWVIECIDSVRSQTFTDWEMILIDDKSPVEPTEAKYRYNDDIRIRWLENAQNEGPSKTRNTAVLMAVSECILPLDSDDMLASADVLEQMYAVWAQDTTKTIYGNLQLFMPGDHGFFERGAVQDLGQYTFELAMNLQGVMPVTAMHSKDCHYATAGEISPGTHVAGWKSQLPEGLEDVEYWVAAGKQGYCGIKIPMTTLLYRRHGKNRSLIFRESEETKLAVQLKIKQMHSDIYSGRFPVACCGKAEVNPAVALDPAVMSDQVGSLKITTLEERGFSFRDEDMEWVLFDGPQTGSLGSVIVRGPAQYPQSYPVSGKGHIFQIHKRHHNNFSAMQRRGYRMNQPDPRIKDEAIVEAPQTVEPAPVITEIAPPEFSTIERIDAVALQAGVVPDVQPMPEGFVEPEPTPEPVSFSPPPQPIQAPLPDTTPTIDAANFAQAERDYLEREAVAQAKIDDSKTNFNIVELELSPRINDLLVQDSERKWTVERIARSEPADLMVYGGVGRVTAQKIIAKAQRLVDGR